MAIGIIDDSTLYDIGDAIREKNKVTTKYLPQEMPNAIRSISGGVELPELGDTAAQASDMALGKTLYDDEGNPVTGTLGDLLPGAEGRYIFRANARVSGDTSLFVEAESLSHASPVIHRPGSTATILISSEAFGKAARSQVAKGATFTSEAGLLAEGELEEIEAGHPIGAKEDIVVRHNSDGTIMIMAKTNWGDAPDAIVRNGAYLRITAPESTFDGIFGGTGGQYCWKKYKVNNNYEVTTENLGTTAPSDLGSTYYRYTITNDGYYSLSSGDITLSTYHLPTGATNGKTKYIYYKAWGYSFSTYYKWTLSDTYTQGMGDFLGYVTSDDANAHISDGIDADGYWYVSLDTEQQTGGD